MDDRILKNGDYFIDRAILRPGNFSYWTTVRLLGQPERLMQNPWWHAVRVRNVTKIHPGTNGFVLVVVPIDSAPHGANSK